MKNKFEKFNPVKKIEGNISKNKKKDILNWSKSEYRKQDFDKDKERKKSKKEKYILDLANRTVAQIRKKYGLKGNYVSENVLHAIKENKWDLDDSISAEYKEVSHKINYRKPPFATKMRLAHTFLHELIHLNSYNALQVREGEEEEEIISLYRQGLKVCKRKGDKSYFEGFNEAITEELVRSYIWELWEDKVFEKELKMFFELKENFYIPYLENLLKELNQEPNPNKDKIKEVKETLKEVRTGELLEIKEGKLPDGSSRIFFSFFDYPKERKNLNNLIDKIYERNQDKFKNREEVFDVFAKAMLTGNILSLGKIIDKTFGQGIFRKIGELDDDLAKQEEFINSL